MIEEKAVELMAKFEAIARQFAPEVVNGAISVVHLNGVIKITAGLMLLILATLAAIVSIKTCNFFKKKKEKIGDEFQHKADAAAAIGVISVFVLFFLGICNIIDAWSWIAIFNPKLALARAVLGL